MDATEKRHCGRNVRGKVCDPSKWSMSLSGLVENVSEVTADTKGVAVCREDAL